MFATWYTPIGNPTAGHHWCWTEGHQRVWSGEGLDTCCFQGGRRLDIACWKHQRLHYKLRRKEGHSQPAVPDSAGLHVRPNRKCQRAGGSMKPLSNGFFLRLVIHKPLLFDTYVPLRVLRVGGVGGRGGVWRVTSLSSVRARPQSLSSIQIFGLSARAAVCRCSCLSLCFNRLTPGFPHQRHSNSPALIPAALRCVTDCSVSP